MKRPQPTTSRLAGFALAITLLTAGACAGNADTDRTMQSKNARAAAAEFLPQVEQVLAPLSVRRESFEVRANRCEGRQGETRDDLYYIWIGLRGAAQAGDIAQQIEAAHARWEAAGWNITRFRRLDNGGVNLTAVDPATGNTYTLDSGFDPAPDAYLVGFFSTPCYQAPEGKVAFGTIAL